MVSKTLTQVAVDARAAGVAVNPVWKRCVGAGRAAEALRADFQRHLELAQKEVGFEHLRCHGALCDEMMAYRDAGGEPVHNWQYLDMVYDHWISLGIRPFVELSFMPYDLASGDETVFWWRGNITPPKDWGRWEQLVRDMVVHFIERYGLPEVRRWYFEVWNEPDLSFFWQGADFDAYVSLYERTASVVKSVDGALRVGGPATSGAEGTTAASPTFAERFLAACAERDLPIDFFSTHPYPTFHAFDADGNGAMSWLGADRLQVDLERIDKLLATFGYSDLERHLTEWSSSPSPRDPSHDTAFMAPFVIRNNLLARDRVDSLSFWVVSDIFEEGRLGDGPFHGGFGLLNVQGLKKPSFHGYWFLSRLGPTGLGSGDSFVATRRDDGALAVLLWNYCHFRPDARLTGLACDPYELFEPAAPRRFVLDLAGVEGQVRVATTRFDRSHGSVYDGWAEMGRPAHLSREDVEALRQRAELATSVERTAVGEAGLRREVVVDPHGVVLVEVSPVGGRPAWA
jgi:xylan 1,4-beta-xylosidase